MAVINHDELAGLVVEFLETQDDATKDETYCTERAGAEAVLDKFLNYVRDVLAEEEAVALLEARGYKVTKVGEA